MAERNTQSRRQAVQLSLLPEHFLSDSRTVYADRFFSKRSDDASVATDFAELNHEENNKYLYVLHVDDVQY